MKKGYWIVSYWNDSDVESLKAYSPFVGPALEAFGGKVLVRGIPAEVGGTGERKRTVVVEFESLEKAMAAYRSPAYAEAKSKLSPTIQRDFRIVEGIE